MSMSAVISFEYLIEKERKKKRGLESFFSSE